MKRPRIIKTRLVASTNPIIASKLRYIHSDNDKTKQK